MKQLYFRKIGSKISVICLVAIIFSVGILGACNSGLGEETPDEKMKSTIQSLFLQLCDINANGADDSGAVGGFVQAYLQKHDIDFSMDKAGNIFSYLPATATYEGDRSTTLLAHMKADISWKNDYIEDKTKVYPLVDDGNKLISSESSGLGAASKMSLATTLYLLSHTKVHGKIHAIFVNGTDQDVAAIKKISSNYIQTDYLIGFEGFKSGTIYNQAAITSIYKSSLNFEKIDTHLKNAYVVKAENFSGGSAGLFLEDRRGNPLLFISQFLTDVKAQGISYELCKLDAKAALGELPNSAMAVLSVGDYEAKKLNSIFKKTADAYKKEHEKSEPGLSLALAQTIPPAKSLSAEDTSKISTFLYTLPTGTYGDDELGAYIQTGSVSIGDNSLDIDLILGAKETSTIQEMAGSIGAVVKMSQFSVNNDQELPGFFVNPKLKLPLLLQEAYSTVLNKEPLFSLYPNYSIISTLVAKHKDVSPIILGFDIRHPDSAYEELSTENIAMVAKVLTSFLAD